MAVLGETHCLRRAALAGVALLVVGLALLAVSARRAPELDWLITDVRILRDREITTETANVGIVGERIAYVGSDRPRAKRSVNGGGKILAPGFLDTNATGFVVGRGGTLKLYDGVTSYLLAHGGLPGDIGTGVMALNYSTTVGIIGFEASLARDATFDLSRAFDDAIAAGAYGISFSPEYRRTTTPDVITKTCRHFAGRNVPIAFHTRFSNYDDELAGLDEALSCARLGNPIHVLHITSTGGTYHPREALQRVMDARHAGDRVFVDFYPYTAWSSPVGQARFDGAWLDRYRVTFKDVRVAGRAGEFTASTFADFRARNPTIPVMVDSIPRETVDLFALSSDATIGSDTNASESAQHPRGTASFTTFLEHYALAGKLPLGETMYRFSTMAYERFAPFIPELKERGRIAPGYHADLVLWDVSKIKVRATADDPYLPSEGVVLAFVNGTPLIMDGVRLDVGFSTGHFMTGRAARSP